MLSRRILLTALVLSLASILGACSSGTPQDGTPCVGDPDCPSGQLCQRGTCRLPGNEDAGAPDSGVAPRLDGGGQPPDGGTPLDGGTLADGGVLEDGGALGDGGVVTADGGGDAGVADAGGVFGGTCSINADCLSGICLQTAAGTGICSKPCSQDCPIDWGCRLVNLTPVCVPAELAVCTTCTRDDECGGSFRCTSYAGANTCLRECTSSAQCGASEECRLIAALGDGGTLVTDGGVVTADAGLAGRCVPASDRRNCGACGNQCGTAAGVECCGDRCVNLLTDRNRCGTTCANAVACTGAAQCCNGTCVDVSVSDTHCGACQNAGGSTCTGDNQKCCGGSCVSIRDNNLHCGSCAACTGGLSCCGASCVGLSTDTTNCRACGTTCDNGQACCGSDGCTTTVNNDSHCGTCGNDCTTQFTDGGAGRCCGDTCKDKLRDKNACGNSCTTCGGTTPACCNGSCADLDKDDAHCGACSGGASTCAPGSKCCGGVCKNVQNDVANCGGCGIPCGANQTCCSGQCKSLQTDLQNCGICGRTCGAGETCCAGSCKNLNTDATFCGTSCANAQNCGSSSCCSGACKNTASGDPANCGACSRVCGIAETLPHTESYSCAANACQVATCASGFYDCGAGAGCETTLETNTSCATAEPLGQIDDTGATTAVERIVSNQSIIPGQSRWYRIFAFDGFGNDWKFIAKLQNITAGTNLDLYVYRRAHNFSDPSLNSCTGVTPDVIPQTAASCTANYGGCSGSVLNSDRCSTNAGNASECIYYYEACSILDLETDDAEVWIEIRHVSGGCATFELKLRNNGDNDPLNCSNY